MKPPHRKKARRRLTRQLHEVRRRFIQWVNSGAIDDFTFNGKLKSKIRKS